MSNTTSFCCVAATGTVSPTTSGQHFIKIVTNFSAGTMYLVVRGTTLFSPWLSKGAGFEGFVELHNNAAAAINVTLRGYDSAGVFVGVVLTHDGTFGAISGNITTLNGANGLSFDSPFAPRTDGVRIQ